MPMPSHAQRGGAGGPSKDRDERRRSSGSSAGVVGGVGSARRATGHGAGASSSRYGAGTHHHPGSPVVYKSAAGRSAAAAGRNVFAGSPQQQALHNTAGGAGGRRGVATPNNSPAASSPASSRRTGSASTSPSTPGSVRSRAVPAPGGPGFPGVSPTAARSLSTSGKAAPSPSSSGSPGVSAAVTARRRRLTSTFGGDEPEDTAAPHTSARAPASTDSVREVGFSVLTAATGMDTDRRTGVGRCKLVYGSSTHPGNDPGGYQKDNQDAWVVKENFGNQKGIFFGVFDGHGYDGRKVSHALVSRLPKMLAGSDKFKAGKVPEAASQACIDCNAAIKRVTTINTDLSGSTGIMAYLHGNGTMLTVINVGDSRCILGKADPGGSTEGIPLNVDHTPSIPEEAARIRQHKGRIGAFMHLGQPVGPLRVWLADRDVPGLCMTRSFGDDVAATVGVYSQPEIHEVVLRGEDKYLILCSDGITEFMSNDEIVAFVHKHVQIGPVEIAKRLVRESRKRWQAEEDDVIDDCTAIIIFLQQVSSSEQNKSSALSSPPVARHGHRASIH